MWISIWGPQSLAIHCITRVAYGRSAVPWLINQIITRWPYLGIRYLYLCMLICCVFCSAVVFFFLLFMYVNVFAVLISVYMAVWVIFVVAVALRPCGLVVVRCG